MKIVATSHAAKMFVVRELIGIVEQSYLLPYPVVKKYKLSPYPESVVSEKKFYYAFNPDTNHFFCLQLDSRRQELKVLTVWIIEDVRREGLKEEISERKCWRVKEFFSFCTSS